MLTGLIYATSVFRIARALGLDVMVSDFVEAARVRGEGLWWIVSREILPNVAMPMATDFGLRFVYVILFISSLSFLGLGVQPPQSDWGSMVRESLAGAPLRLHRAAGAGDGDRHPDHRHQPDRRRRLRPRRRQAGQEDDLMAAPAPVAAPRAPALAISGPMLAIDVTADDTSAPVLLVAPRAPAVATLATSAIDLIVDDVPAHAVGEPAGRVIR